MNRRLARAVGALAAATVIAAVPSAANAAHARWGGPTGSGFDGDTHRCATHREVWLTGNPDLTRPMLEHRWEVRGKGHRKFLPYQGKAWLYPICGRDDQWATASFTKRGYLFGVGIWTPNKPDPAPTAPPVPTGPPQIISLGG